jgi:hypothetical protein
MIFTSVLLLLICHAKIYTPSSAITSLISTLFCWFFTQFARNRYDVLLPKRNAQIAKLVAYKRQGRPNNFYKTNINFKLIIKNVENKFNFWGKTLEREK